MQTLKKLLILITYLTFSVSLSANELPFEKMFFTVVDSGSGGGILGHTFLTFCPDQIIFNLSECHGVEYNLDINVGEKYEMVQKLGLRRKLAAFQRANFRVYEYSDARQFANKYIERDQSIKFYRFNGDEETVDAIYRSLLDEKERRERFDIKDYEIRSNNCVTKLFDVINEHANSVIEKTSDSSFDLDNLVYQFPIFTDNRLRESGLFDSYLFLSESGSYSKILR